MYYAACFEPQKSQTKVFSTQRKLVNNFRGQTWTVSGTERNVVLPLRESAIDRDGGRCAGLIISNGLETVGLSSGNKELELRPCMVGVLEIRIMK